MLELSEQFDYRFIARAKRFSIAAGVFIILVGAIVLTGWLLDLTRLKSIHGGLDRIESRAQVTVTDYQTVRVRKDGQKIDISLTISPIRRCENLKENCAKRFILHPLGVRSLHALTGGLRFATTTGYFLSTLRVASCHCDSQC